MNIDEAKLLFFPGVPTKESLRLLKTTDLRGDELAITGMNTSFQDRETVKSLKSSPICRRNSPLIYLNISCQGGLF
jgi:hypothetical protein